MDEMQELKKQIDGLKQRVNFLEETINIIADISTSEIMSNYLRERKHTLALTRLINETSSDVIIDEEKQKEAIETITREKGKVDARLTATIAVSNSQENDSDSAVEKLFAYDLVDEGIEIQGFNGFEVSTLVVPAEIEGIPVIGIGEDAFKHLNMVEVELPDSIRYIKARAFWGCKKISKIVLPPKLKRIDMCAFDATDIKLIVIPESVDTIAFDAFFMANVNKMVFLGSTTKFVKSLFNTYAITRETEVFCLAGSMIQKQARGWGVIVKPLSAFHE